MAFNQLHVGREEPIIEPDLPIIDAHHHLFHRPALRYLFEDYLADTCAGHRIVASVYVETQAFSRRAGPAPLKPLGEIEFANGIGAMADNGLYGDCRICAAIVGYADLRNGAAIGDYLDQAMALAPLRFRGIRQVTIDDPSEAPYRFIPLRPDRNIMGHPEFRNGFRELVRRGLVFDAALFHHQLPDVMALADAFPCATISLNHTGHAMFLGLAGADLSAARRTWQDNMRELARRPNVVCKVGGLGLPYWGFGFEERTDPIGYRELAAAWRPYVEGALEAFGFERCMAESDYPIDSRAGGFVPLWNALKYIVGAASPGEKAAFFHETAARVYRIEVNTAVAAAAEKTPP
jgi:predicted TIM-barrel fold metal-dependent hydrolase